MILNPNLRTDVCLAFETDLQQRIIGQDRAVRTMARIYQTVEGCMNDPGRPLANVLLLGPTGTGKTRLVEAVAECLFADAKAVIRVNCAEFQHGHEISKLTGSPPGFVGHRETEGMITKKALERCWTDKGPKISLLLFDEVEKAHFALWQLLLGILDKGEITLGTNEIVDLSRCLVFMTSNTGSTEIANVITGGLGFSVPHDDGGDTDQKVYTSAKSAAKRVFAPEFLNRIDSTIVFRTLQRDSLHKILDIELDRVHGRAGKRLDGFAAQYTDAAREFLLAEGTDPKYGARPLKRAVNRFVTLPLAGFIATKQVHTGQIVYVDRQPGEKALTFEAKNLVSLGAQSVVQ